MRHGNRKSNLTNRQQNGTWLTRYRKDGVFPAGKRKAIKGVPNKAYKQTNDVIPSDKIKSFCNHPDSLRLSVAIPKVQIEGLNLYINEAQKEDNRAIMISFLLQETTKKLLKAKKFRVKSLSPRKSGPDQIQNHKILISW